MESGISNTLDLQGSSVSEDSSRTRTKYRLKGKKYSEWVFRPLKMKFKVKELEHLYDSAVYWQRQGLLLGANIIMAAHSLLVLLVSLGKKKV